MNQVLTQDWRGDLPLSRSGKMYCWLARRKKTALLVFPDRDGEKSICQIESCILDTRRCIRCSSNEATSGTAAPIGSHCLMKLIIT